MDDYIEKYFIGKFFRIPNYQRDYDWDTGNMTILEMKLNSRCQNRPPIRRFPADFASEFCSKILVSSAQRSRVVEKLLDLIVSGNAPRLSPNSVSRD